MALHLLKLCVGIDSVEQLREAQARRLAQLGQLRHVTRQTPRRALEILDGGSLYWVIKGAVRARQRIVGIEPVEVDGIPKCALLLGPELVPTVPQPRRPHQGWRYLRAEDAPADLDGIAEEGQGDAPPEMVAKLKELGLI